MSMRLYHGGVPGLRIGDLIEPRPDRDERHLVDGCPTCEARRRGEQLAADDNDPSLIYVTTDREYARIYASGSAHISSLADAIGRGNTGKGPAGGGVVRSYEEIERDARDEEDMS